RQLERILLQGEDLSARRDRNDAELAGHVQEAAAGQIVFGDRADHRRGEDIEGEVRLFQRIGDEWDIGALQNAGFRRPFHDVVLARVGADILHRRLPGRLVEEAHLTWSDAVATDAAALTVRPVENRLALSAERFVDRK